jgi:hypothetical protein
MTHARAGHGKRSVRDENMLDTVHDNPTTNTRHISSTTGRLLQRTAWRIMRDNKLFSFHVQSVQGLQQGTNISCSFLYDIPLMSVPYPEA